MLNTWGSGRAKYRGSASVSRECIHNSINLSRDLEIQGVLFNRTKSTLIFYFLSRRGWLRKLMQCCQKQTREKAWALAGVAIAIVAGPSAKAITMEGDPDVIVDASDVELEEEAEDKEEPLSLPEIAALVNLEQRINANTAFRQFRGLNTRVHSCGVCRCCLLALGLLIPCHKSHTIHVGHSQSVESQGQGKNSA
jgi:hypothetical protein